jgi:hypothetical protein
MRVIDPTHILTQSLHVYINDYRVEIARLIFSIGFYVIFKKYKIQFKIDLSYLTDVLTE